MATCASYRLLRPLLFRLSAETSHQLTFSLLRLFYRLPGAGSLTRVLLARHRPSLPVTAMGLTFPNPVGLAAGLDKNAEYIRPLSDFGFGFLELGTVTPRPQPGNPKPRLFRLPRQAALINRMGFNNVGIGQFLANLSREDRPCPIGINIGKNRDTPVERAVEDYRAALHAAYAQADYIAVNISSPNTAGLRDLQNEENLEELLRALKAEQAMLAEKHGRYVSIALKIAPDLDDAQIAAIARQVLEHKFDAVIATNTTITRPGPASDPVAHQSGGLSGRPLKELSTEIIRKLYAQLRGRIPIIGVGGIENVEDAWDKLVAGADLVQVYTVLIYSGPCVVQAIVRGLAERVQASGLPTLAEAVAQARRQQPD
ncbi:MAG: quinone-dependent dihydroorotate dehydrogenase [Gammaproteobacteria bacterium]|nr:quinone-dependent dihydroorotate dehydrogenase [Gammaproteobacteria bacterium]